jgi:hypothetical protein
LHKNQVIDFQWYFLRIRLRHKPILVIYAGSMPSVARLWKQQAGIARATRAIWTEVGSAAVAEGGGQPLNSRYPSLTGHCGGRPW